MNEKESRIVEARLKLRERFLNRIQLAVLRQTFDRGDFFTVRLHGEVQTRFHDFAFEQHRAGAALADDAPDVRAGKTDILAQKMREQNTRLDVFFIKSSVNSDPNSLFHKTREYRLHENGSSEQNHGSESPRSIQRFKHSRNMDFP